MFYYECPYCKKLRTNPTPCIECRILKKKEKQMSIITIEGGPVTHKYLMGKTKYEIATLYMELLRAYANLETQIKGLEAEVQKMVEELAGENI